LKKTFVALQFCLLLFSLGCSRLPQKESLEPSVVSEPETVKTVSQKKATAKMAIIIDDAGHNLRALDAMLNLPVRLNVAVLPRLYYSKKIAETLHENGFEILLHQPMEPLNVEVDPGPGAIYTTMTEDEVVKTLEENFKQIPHLVGINNHMGSKVTSNKGLMEIVLRTTNKNNLFFIDSVTARSQANEAAKEVGVSIQSRDIFIDNDKDIELIKKQIRRLKDIAQKEGKAIGIGHFFPVTIQAIAQVLPELEAEGVEIVPVSQLLD